MRVWIFQTGEPLPVDGGINRPMRAINLARALNDRGHEVLLLSADFNHSAKSFRGMANRTMELEPGLKIHLFDSSGYRANIGLARVYDHAVLALRLSRWLPRAEELPDVAFVGYPPIESAYVLSRWLRKFNVPFLVDVKDQWPVIFNRKIPAWMKPLSALVLFPYNWMARKALGSANGLSAMADGFLSWALEFGRKNRSDNDAVFPLTTPAEIASAEKKAEAERWWDEQGIVAEGWANICFVGSFSSAFDFEAIRLAAARALDEGRPIRFVLCGSGGEINKVKASMAALNNVFFPGWIDRPRTEALAQRCLASIAPYVSTPDFMLSIPNKVVDSLSLGLPILSPLCGEVTTLIGTEGVGRVYDGLPESGDLYAEICRLVEHPEEREAMAARARQVYAKRFSYEVVYGALVDHLERLARTHASRPS